MQEFKCCLLKHDMDFNLMPVLAHIWNVGLVGDPIENMQLAIAGLEQEIELARARALDNERVPE